ncbi:MAG: carboxymuconolactone decarboxylase family protein [Acidimicrobiia bacterium]
MSHVHPVPRSELAEYEPIFARFERAMGYVPNGLFVMAHRPGLIEAFGTLVGVIMGPGLVDQGLKSLVAEVASGVAGCRYCQAHTAALAHNYGVEESKVSKVWEFEQSDLFSDQERCALQLARDAAQQPNQASPGHFEALSEHFDEKEVLEIVGVISLFGFLNRWNDTLATDLEDEAFEFATRNLSAAGWEAGRHRPSTRSAP